jgi:transcriptional regulator with XRE-family HTH domain
MRALSGLTQFSLSRRSGVSRMRLSLAECGEAELASEEEEKIRGVLFAAIKAQHAKTTSVLAVLSDVKHANA